MEKIKRILVWGLVVAMSVLTMWAATALSQVVYAVPAAPPGGSGGMGQSAANISYNGATTFSTNVSESGQTYASTSGGQNAVLASGGEISLSNFTVMKNGDSSGDEADFYGTNAAILAYGGATLNLTGAEISTNGSHANAVFAYGSGVINISDSTINTVSNNSGGVMVTGGGTLTATSLRVATTGNSAAAIRSDRGGGTLTVEGGEYTTSGTGSPVIYSTADVTVQDATLTATASEGAVVEGANTITLDNVDLTDTNNTLNGNSETYKNILLYQSMSGDADEGAASFTAKNSRITTNQGDTIFVTNTTAEVVLENNKIVNEDGDFLRVQAGKWGTSGANGGTVTLTMKDQEVNGNVVVDEVSKVSMRLAGKSVLNGAINTSGQAGEVKLTLEEEAVVVLGGDTHLDALENAQAENGNIYLNGHKLYVAGAEVPANTGTYAEEVTSEVNCLGSKSMNCLEDATEEDATHVVLWILIGLGVVVLVAVVVVVVLAIRKRIGERRINGDALGAIEVNEEKVQEAGEEDEEVKN